MLDPVLIQDIYNDYLVGPDQYTLMLSGQECQNFFNWFGVHASVYPLSDTNAAEYMDANTRPGRCYGNAQTINLNHRLPYVEGFFFVRNNYVFHAFNILDEKVIDVSVQSSPETYLYNNTLPQFYCGILIPDDLIEQQNAQAINENIINIPHLIHMLYQSQ